MLQKQIYFLLVFFFFSFGVFGQNIAPVIECQSFMKEWEVKALSVPDELRPKKN